MSFWALSSSKVLAELCKLLLGNNKVAPRSVASSGYSDGHCQCPGRWLSCSQPSWQPLSLTSIPYSRHSNQAQGCLGAHWHYGTREPSPFSLLCSHFPAQSFRKRDLINGILNGSTDPYGVAESFRENVRKMGSWVFSSGRFEEKEKEEEKYQQEVVFCFHVSMWLLAWGQLDALQHTPR